MKSKVLTDIENLRSDYESLGKVSVNGVADGANFNFIDNKVVQDGLVRVENNSSEFSIAINTFSLFGNLISTSDGDIISTSVFILRVYNNSVYIVDKSTGIDVIAGIPVILFDDIYVSLSNNNLTFIHSGDTVVVDISKFTVKNNEFIISYQKTKDRYIYNRQLTPQEIQHNFSVLNNSPSLNQLQVTNSTNQTSISFGLGANANHVEMASGRTLEEEYMGVLECMAQEYASTGASITVNDGLKARLVGAEIAGQTVKNYITSLDNKGAGIFTIKDNSWAYSSQTGTQYNEAIYFDTPNIFPSTKYCLMLNITRNTLNKDVSIIHNTSGITSELHYIRIGEVGLKKITFTTKSSISLLSLKTIFDIYTIGELNIELVTVVDDTQKDFTRPLPLGLNSTVATITNNGIKYPFYASLEDKANKKQISFGKVDTVADKLTLNSDGSLNIQYYLGEIKQYNNIELFPSYDTSSVIGFKAKIPHTYGKRNSSGLSNKGTFKYCHYGDEVQSSTSDLSIAMSSTDWCYGTVKKSVLKTVDLNGVNDYFSGLILQYQLDTPTTITIPKEVNAPVLTNQSNILSVGEAVAPSNFKVKMPVSAIDADTVDGKHASDFIEKAQIKNNLTETVEGNVLDATQGEKLDCKITEETNARQAADTNLSEELSTLSNRLTLQYKGDVILNSIKTIEKNWSTFNLGNSLIKSEQGTISSVYIYKLSDIYGSCILHGYEEANISYGRLVNGVWTWKQLATSDEVSILSTDRGYKDSKIITDIDSTKLNGKYKYSGTILGNTGTFSVDVTCVDNLAYQVAIPCWTSAGTRGVVLNRIFVDNAWQSWKHIATTDKIDILFTPTTGYAIVSQSNYKVNNLVCFNVVLEKSDGTNFTNTTTQAGVLTVPPIARPAVTYTETGSIRSAGSTGAYVSCSFNWDGSVYILPSLQGKYISVSGGYLT